jgi:hypothetical protein
LTLPDVFSISSIGSVDFPRNSAFYVTLAVPGF